MEDEAPTAMAAPQISDIVTLKRAARQAALAARAGCNPAWGASLARHVLDACPPPPGAIVAGFWPMQGEIDIRPLLQALHERGHEIVLPRTLGRGQPLAFRLWHPGMEMRREKFGTWCPTGEPRVPDLLFVPLLAFDRAGRRLGYGGGFYDRTLAGLPGATAIGCAFAAQEVDVVPASDYDARLDVVATECGVIVCGENPN
jgi:5-formyltetrahydrofolate cyclo-ligase